MSQENPKVSVIIPVYNTEKYLRECLDSVVNQTLKDIEIICVDDGSTDSSPEILREYVAKDSRVKVFSQEKSNAGAARNVGLSKANGEYLAFLDSDDFYELFMLEHMLTCAMERSVDVVVCRFNAYYENTGEKRKVDKGAKPNLLPHKTVFSYRDIENYAFQCILGYCWDKLIKRALVTDNQLSFQSQKVFNDTLFTHTVLICAESITVLDEYLICYRQRSDHNSITDLRNMYIDSAYTYLIGLKDFLVRSGNYERYEKDFINEAIRTLYVDLTSKGRTAESKMEMKVKIAFWLNEFCANEHMSDYYYSLPEYEKLLCQVLSRKSVQEAEQRRSPTLSTEKQVIIPILYSTDLSHMRYTIVSMLSALQNAQRNTFYAFTIFVPQSSGIDQSSINERLRRFNNYSLSFVELGEEFADIHIHSPHIMSPTLQRLHITGLLDDYDKYIYLDEKTIVCEDLQNLYRTNLHDNYLAGVPAFDYHENKPASRKHIGIREDISFQYINTGVVLFNLRKLQEGNKANQFIQSLGKKYIFQDQDVLDIAHYGKIQLLPYRYNVMPKYAKWKLESFPSTAVPYEIISGRLYPAIIHYSDRVQPWDDFTSPYSNYWLSVAMSEMCWDLFPDISILKKNQITKKTYKSFSQILRGGVQCYQDHGAGYTFRRTLYHMGLWKDEELENAINETGCKRTAGKYILGLPNVCRSIAKKALMLHPGDIRAAKERYRKAKKRIAVCAFEDFHFAVIENEIRICNLEQNYIIAYVSQRAKKEVSKMLGNKSSLIEWHSYDEPNLPLLQSFNSAEEDLRRQFVQHVISRQNLDYTIIPSAEYHPDWYLPLIEGTRHYELIVGAHNINSIFFSDQAPEKKRRLFEKADSYCVLSSDLKETMLSGGITQKKIYVFDQYYDSAEHTINPVLTDRLSFVITGGVEDKRKDYQSVVDALRMVPDIHPKIRLILLGKATTQYAREIVSQLDKMKETGLNAVTYSNYVPEESFSEIMTGTDYLLGPVVVETTFHGVPETYGTTKLSGMLPDMIKYAKPAILINDLKIPSNMESSVIRYSSVEELAKAFRMLTDKRIAEEYAEKARANSEQYALENMLWDRQ